MERLGGDTLVYSPPRRLSIKPLPPSVFFPPRSSGATTGQPGATRHGPTHEMTKIPSARHGNNGGGTRYFRWRVKLFIAIASPVRSSGPDQSGARSDGHITSGNRSNGQNSLSSKVPPFPPRLVFQRFKRGEGLHQLKHPSPCIPLHNPIHGIHKSSVLKSPYTTSCITTQERMFPRVLIIT